MHIGFLLLIAALLIPSSVSAEVPVYGEGTYAEDELTISIYADITGLTELRSAGVTLTYDPSEMIVAAAEKNDSLWFIDNEFYMNPDTDTPGQVVVLVFKLDSLDAAAGVSGEKMLLGAGTFKISRNRCSVKLLVAAICQLHFVVVLVLDQIVLSKELSCTGRNPYLW